MRTKTSLVAASLIACGLFAPSGAPARAGSDDLAGLRGHSRPIIVLSDSRDDPRVARQIAALDHTRSALGERDVKVLREAKPGSALRRSLGVAERGFAVVLVGKDGGVKKVWKEPVDPRSIFTVIDAMPMRREEMKG